MTCSLGAHLGAYRCFTVTLKFGGRVLQSLSPACYSISFHRGIIASFFELFLFRRSGIRRVRPNTAVFAWILTMNKLWRKTWHEECGFAILLYKGISERCAVPWSFGLLWSQTLWKIYVNLNSLSHESANLVTTEVFNAAILAVRALRFRIFLKTKLTLWTSSKQKGPLLWNLWNPGLGLGTGNFLLCSGRGWVGGWLLPTFFAL